jgi:uncharacterized protein DUF3570
VQLAIVAVMLLDSAVARVGVYADDDDLTVWSPQVNADVAVAGGASLDAGWTADVISAATVDVRTAASPRGAYHETRHELHLGPRYRLRPGTDLRAGYTFSVEPDYTSHQVSAGLSHETLRRRLALALGYRLLRDTVGRVGEPSFARDLRGQAADLSADVALDRRTVVGAAYTVQRLDGFQASPYRLVPLRDETGSLRAALGEATPEERWRHAASLRARRALPWRIYATGLYRYYLDSWDVRSHTGEIDVARSLRGDRGTLGVRARGYTQGAADFQQPSYDTFPLVPRYRTADKKLGRNRSLLAGVRGDWAPAGPLSPSRFEASLDLYDQWFLDFPPLRRRVAALLSLGWSAEW